MKDKYLKLVLLAPTVVFLLGMSIFPLIYSLSLSFTSYNLFKIQKGIKLIYLKNYVDALLDTYVHNAFLNTFVFTGMAITMQFLLGLGMALLFFRKVKVSQVLTSIVIVPMMMMPLVTGFFWRFALNPEYGIMIYFSRQLGINIGWLTDTSIVLLTVAIVDTWQWAPFMFLIFFAGLSSLPREPFEAAKIDGSTSWQAFIYITLPLMKSFILIAVLLRALDAFRLFDVVWSLTFGGPGDSSILISYWIYVVGLKYMKVGYGAAISFVMLALITVMTLFFIRTMRAEEKTK